MCLTRSSLCPKTGVMLESVASTIVWLPRVSRSGSPVRGRSICVTTELRVWSMGSVATWMWKLDMYVCAEQTRQATRSGSLEFAM